MLSHFSPTPNGELRIGPPPGAVDHLVGFDLDMTLLDSAAGIAATYRALSEQTGVFIDVDLVVSRLGPGLAMEMANWFPSSELAGAIARYRELYPRFAMERTVPLPGAVAALAAVRAAGWRIAVVTAKLERFARSHLDHLGLAVDAVVGDVYADGKAAALRDLRARVFVGDHVADVRAAVAAGPGVAAVGVATGPHSASELAAAGADLVLPDLTGFPAWFRSWL